PTASISATTNGSGLSLSGSTATIQSLNKSSLTLGGTSTGNISLVNNTVLASGTTLTQLGTGQVTFGGNVDATNGLDVTGNNLTVGGAAFTVDKTTGAITTTATGNALTLSGAGANIAFTGAGLAELTTAASQNLSLVPGGNVGINTTTPVTTL